MKITSRSGTAVEGQVTWPELSKQKKKGLVHCKPWSSFFPPADNAVTKFKGTLEGDEFAFEEYDTQSKEVVVPVNYVGKLVSKLLMQGSFKAASDKGTFDLKLS
jgi:hypothetical protein